MLIYNTTYHIEEEVLSNFLIWLKESYIHEVQQTQMLHNPRLCKILSHAEPGVANYSLQWEVESSGFLHRWHLTQGMALNEELIKLFADKVVGIPTLLEAVKLD